MNDGNNLSKEGVSSKCTHVCLRFPCLNAASRDMSRLLAECFLWVLQYGDLWKMDIHLAQTATHSYCMHLETT